MGMFHKFSDVTVSVLLCIPGQKPRLAEVEMTKSNLYELLEVGSFSATEAPVDKERRLFVVFGPGNEGKKNKAISAPEYIRTLYGPYFFFKRDEGGQPEDLLIGDVTFLLDVLGGEDW